MFKIEGKEYENHSEENEYTFTILPAKGEKYIENSLDINCNKIVIFKNSAIAFYLDEKVLSFVEAVNCTIDYEFRAFEKTGHILIDKFTLIYSNVIGYDKNLNYKDALKEKDKHGNIINKEIVIEYPSFNRDENNSSKNHSRYKIGDLVFPENMAITVDGKETYYSILYNEVLYNDTKLGKNGDKATKYLLDIVNENTGKIIDIVNCIKDKIYIIDVNGKQVCATSKKVTDSYEETRSISKFLRWANGR